MNSDQEQNQEQKIFRQQAVDRLSSPDQLDQLIHIVKVQDWLNLSVLVILFTLTVIWAWFARIPVFASGKGVLIYPRRVVEIQSPIAGQLEQIKVNVGDCVQKDNNNQIDEPQEIIALLDPIAIKKELQQEKLNLRILQQQNQNFIDLEQQKNNLQLQALQEKRAILQQQLQDNQILIALLRQTTDSAIQQKRISVQQSLQDAKALIPVFNERLQTRRELLSKGAIAQDIVLEAEQTYQQNLQQISELQTQLKQIEVESTNSRKQYTDSLNNISEIKIKIQQIDTEEKSLTQAELSVVTDRKNQLLQVQQKIETLEQQLKRNSIIKSPYSGCILELTINDGQIVNPGIKIGSMEIKSGTGDKLLGVTYFNVEDAKKIKPGMEIQITPSPVKREQFGGIIAQVISVSPFPVTKQGAANVLGNVELVESLITNNQEPQIEVWAELKPNQTNFSRYEWSTSTGPEDLSLSPGTTTTAKITLEQRQPISFILPFLREWSGIN
ncbi:MAG: NHLP bacteriocin system secretion protein [Sphaerospermopsis sp. SIO1G2]|nr:NHLP bacteriocin system secretion protein [Sphaerospermopsis sp. SIO1G2]